MDYEKAYKEALEAMEDCIPNKDGYVTVRPCDIFPELAESEDERMRKDCIKYLDWEYQHCPINEDKMKIEKCIAWLEKQTLKPKWSEGDEQYLLICKNALRKYQVSDKWDADIISKWLEDKLKQRMEGQQ